MRKFKRFTAALMTAITAVCLCCISVTAEASTVFGDANGDGTVNIIDLVRLKKITVGVAEIDELYLVDADYDGKISSTDLAYCRKVLLGLTQYGTVTSLEITENSTDIPTEQW